MEGLTEEEYYLLALGSIEGIGAIRANSLLQKFQTAKAVFDAPKAAFYQGKSTILPVKIIQDILSKSSFQRADEEMKFCKKNDIDIRTIYSKEYPARLRTMEDRPLLIYKRGNIHPHTQKTLAIVGTRKSTEYGHKFLESLFQNLKELNNIAVISGLAIGIDYKAHQLALEHNIPTIGVMGLALDRIYPSGNNNLAKSILSANGGWLTETSSRDKITQGVFPRRNRIIAGMSDAILVVETDVEGGAVITAQFGNEYNKEVYALPGRINDPQSRGCNELIYNNLASIVSSPNTIIDSMNWESSATMKKPKVIEIDFEGSEHEKKVLDTIRKFPKIELEKLSTEADLPHSKLVEVLLGLELDNWIVALPGNKYELN